MGDPLLRFVLARTEKNTKRPYFDDLSHHSLIVAFSQLHENNPTFVMAGLLHDYFKGLLFFNNGNWNHISEEKHYKEIIPKNLKNIDEKELIELIYHHQKGYPQEKDHKKIWKQNPIKFAETGEGNLRGIVGTLESRIFISHNIYGLKSFRILPKGRYHWLLMAAIHEEMKKYLSELYSRKLKALLNVSAIEYRYVPISLSGSFASLSQCVDSLKIEKYHPYAKNDHFVIPIPVRDLCEEFTITYSGAESITIANNNIEIPFGEALALFAFTGNEIMLSYVDPGYDTDITVLLKRILEKGKKTIEFPYTAGELKNSLKGEYSALENCSFCGNPASEIILAILNRDRFTDVTLLFNDHAVACPVCYAGYLLEQEKVPYIRPQEAEIYEPEITPPFQKEIHNEFAVSASGLMWQQVLSAIWYNLFISNKFPEFILDPYVHIHPITVKFAPRAFFPMAWRSGNKKYCLQSTVHSDLTALGSVENVSTEEFKELSKAYRINRSRIDKRKMLGKIKSIYGIRI